MIIIADLHREARTFDHHVVSCNNHVTAVDLDGGHGFGCNSVFDVVVRTSEGDAVLLAELLSELDHRLLLRNPLLVSCHSVFVGHKIPEASGYVVGSLRIPTNLTFFAKSPCAHLASRWVSKRFGSGKLEPGFAGPGHGFAEEMVLLGIARS